MEKKCSKCGEIKSIDLFNKTSSGRGLFGKRGECKVCQSDQFKKYYDIKYNTDEEFRKRNIISALKWVKNNPEKRAEIAKRRNQKAKDHYPEKTKARALVNQKVRFGRIPRASDLKCHTSDCENMAKHYHHYKGYAFENRYDVIPLCVECHRKEDAHL